MKPHFSGSLADLSQVTDGWREAQPAEKHLSEQEGILTLGPQGPQGSHFLGHKISTGPPGNLGLPGRIAKHRKMTLLMAATAEANRTPQAGLADVSSSAGPTLSHVIRHVTSLSFRFPICKP